MATFPVVSAPISLPGSSYSSTDAGTSPESVGSGFFKQDSLFSSFIENNVKELIVFDMRNGRKCAKSQKQICYLHRSPSLDYSTALKQELSEIYSVNAEQILRKQISFSPSRAFPEFRRKSKKGDREVVVLMDSNTDCSDQTFLITTFHPDMSESQEKIRLCQRHEKTDVLDKCVELAIQSEINARPQDFHILKGALKLDRTKTFEETLTSELTSLDIDKQRDITIRCIYNHTGDSKSVYNLRCLSTDNVQEAKEKFFQQFKNTHPKLKSVSSAEMAKIWFLQNDRYLKDSHQILLETSADLVMENRTSFPTAPTEGSVTVDITGADGVSITLHLRQIKADAMDKRKVVVIPKTTILDDLKEVVCRYFSIPTHAQRLKINRRTLQHGAVQERKMEFETGCIVNVERTKPFALLFDPDEHLRRRLSLPSVINLEVYKGHKINDIQDLLADRLDIPSSQLTMTFQGIHLDPDSEHSLRDHRIRNRDIIELTWYPNRVLFTLIAPWQRRQRYAVIVNDTETSSVRELKQLIGDNLQRQSTAINLLHNQSCLDDGSTLLEAGISSGDTVIITRRTTVAAFSELPINCGGVFQCGNGGEIQQLFVTYISGIPFFAPTSVRTTDFIGANAEAISSDSVGKIGKRLDRIGEITPMRHRTKWPCISVSVDDCDRQRQYKMKPLPLDENVTTDATLHVLEIDASLSDSAMGGISRSRCGHGIPENTESSVESNRRIKSNVSLRCRNKEETDPKEYLRRRRGVFFDRCGEYNNRVKQPLRRERSNTMPYKGSRAKLCHRNSYRNAILDEDSSDEENPSSSNSPTSSGEINQSFTVKSPVCLYSRMTPQDNNLSNPLIDGNVLRKVACRLGKKWKNLARSLRLPEYEIEDIDNNYSQNLHEQSYQSLLRWQQRMGYQANKRALISSLMDVGLRDIVDTLHLEYETS